MLATYSAHFTVMAITFSWAWLSQLSVWFCNYFQVERQTGTGRRGLVALDTHKLERCR